LLGFLHHRLVLRSRDVPALRFLVLQRLDALRACLLRHGALLLQEMNPIGRFGRALRASSSAISFLIASKTTANCSSYFSSIASILRASSRLESISRRNCTKVRMIAMLTSTARAERRTLESIATPCSVNA